MAKHVSVATAIEKNKIASDKAFVVLLSIDTKDESGNFVETIRFAKNTEDLVYQGEPYVASNFEINYKEDHDSPPTLTITMPDPTNTFRDQLEAYSGAVGFDCVFTVINTGNMEQPPEFSEEFTIIAASADNYTITLQLGVENMLTIRFPPNMQYQDQCTKVYKGVRCKYSGSLTTCDFTRDGPNGCKVHNNAANFGGFSGMQPLAM